jgi:stage II sporulation protein M
MNKLYEKIKNDMLKDKSIYYALLITLLISIVFGGLFITIIKDTDKTLVLNQIQDFFNSIKDNNIDYIKELKNSVFSNSLYIVIIWLLGISIIGIPIIICMLFFKGFTLGFTITSIIYKYKVSGIIGALTYSFPHLIINIAVFFVISYYALKLSFTILRSLLKREAIDIKYYINKYLAILGIAIIALMITSLIETYISPYLIKLFLTMVK